MRVKTAAGVRVLDWTIVPSGDTARYVFHWLDLKAAVVQVASGVNCGADGCVVGRAMTETASVRRRSDEEQNMERETS